MGKLAKKLRKEIKRVARDRVADIDPKECVRSFLEQAMELSFWNRLKFAVGLIMKRRKILPLCMTINEIRQKTGLPVLDRMSTQEQVRPLA